MNNKEQIDAIKEAVKQLGENPGAGLTTLLKAADKLSDPIKEPFKPTSIRTKATVHVMLSYNYNHFEASIELSGENIPLADIDNARKDCQRLCDKAVGQYKTAKEKEATRIGDSYERQQLEKEVRELKKMKEDFLTIEGKAKIKAWDDYVYQTRYNYDDDDLYTGF